jgi:hypothetical protein
MRESIAESIDSVLNLQTLPAYLPCTRRCRGMLIRYPRRFLRFRPQRGLLPTAVLVAVLLAMSAGVPIWSGHFSGKKASHWQAAVYRFDTSTVFACERFAQEVAQALPSDPLTSSGVLWERLPIDRQAMAATPNCLIQAGLMVL